MNTFPGREHGGKKERSIKKIRSFNPGQASGTELGAPNCSLERDHRRAPTVVIRQHSTVGTIVTLCPSRYVAQGTWEPPVTLPARDEPCFQSYGCQNHRGARLRAQPEYSAEARPPVRFRACPHHSAAPDRLE